MKCYSRSISEQVLNVNTGEFETKLFTEDVSYTNNIKRGYRRMYTGYDEVVIAMSSPKESEIMIDIRDMFSKERFIISINQSTLAKKHNVSREKVNKLVRKLCEKKLIRKEDNSVYRLNPYIYIPYNANAELMQRQWDE